MIYVWETATSQKKGLTSISGPYSDSMALSDDGNLLATSYVGDKEHVVIELWDLATGQSTKIGVRAGSGQVGAMCFSPDGRVLTYGTASGNIFLWELVSSCQRGIISGHRGAVRCLSFFPDGRMLASGGDDTSVLIWDLLNPTPRGARTKSESNDLSTAWKSLGARDGRAAYEALLQLSARGAETCALLTENLHPISRVEENNVAALVNALNDSQFKTREEATRDLAKLGPACTSHLRRVLQDNPTAEQRRRIESLLAGARPSSSEESLRAYRAIELLERMGGNEAVRLLQQIASGAPGAWLTDEARAALSRMKVVGTSPGVVGR
jgi:hypothetical protein